jgi:hypothetical protein
MLSIEPVNVGLDCCWLFVIVNHAFTSTVSRRELWLSASWIIVLEIE